MDAQILKLCDFVSNNPTMKKGRVEMDAQILKFCDFEDVKAGKLSAPVVEMDAQILKFCD